jgi:hypothetical protein
MAVVVDQKFASDPLCLDDVSFRAKRPQTDDLADNAVPRYFYWREMAGIALCECGHGKNICR